MAGFNHGQQIRAAEVRLVYEQLPSALIATIVNAVILTAVLWKEIFHSFLIGWLLVVLLVVCARYCLRVSYLRNGAGIEEDLRWERQYLYGVAANGVLWGFAGFFFFTAVTFVHQVFLAFVLMGMVSGGTSTLSAIRGTYLVFMIPALLPYGVRLFFDGGGLHLAMAGMLVVYATMMGMISHRLNATVAESLRLRFDNLDLLEDLRKAKQRQEVVNQELAAQVAEKHRAQDALEKAFAGLEKRVEERTAELARSEEALRVADRRKDEFLAMLGHELRNPIAPIRNALHLMQESDVSDSVMNWGREIIGRQIDHLTRLVDDLLDVSRIAHGKIKLQENIFEIATVINQAVEGSRPLIEERQQKLSVHVPAEPLWIKGDLVRLDQVISNLLNNAAKYSESGNCITVNVEATDRWVIVRIKDNGIGISPEVLPHVFDLFAQADHRLAQTQGGLGIGLTLVKRLVEMHGGTVEAHSQGPGHGSEFLVNLPRQVSSPEKATVSERPRAGAAGDRLRVLVVDDNHDAAETLAAIMSLKGHTVATAFDGATALEEASRFQPQVVLLDIGMPGMNGYEVARELRAREGTRSTIIVALTGYGQPEDRARAAEAGFTDHLTKPISPENLLALLKTHLSNSLL
jgi:signal transduction histidine kinase/ActR/RegA family two-component response regulator